MLYQDPGWSGCVKVVTSPNILILRDFYLSVRIFASRRRRGGPAGASVVVADGPRPAISLAGNAVDSLETQSKLIVR